MSKKEKVTEFIIDSINSGKYRDGSKIMSENMLSYYLNVTKYSVREALKELEEKNIVYKIKGSGTFVKLTENSIKYIIVSINEDKFFNENTNVFVRLLEYLKTKIKNKGYIPYIHLEKSSLYSYDSRKNHFLESIPIDIKNIKGLINIGGDLSRLRLLEEREIPIVTLFQRDKYPFVDFNYYGFYKHIRKLLTKYSLNKIAVFTYIDNSFLGNLTENEKKLEYNFYSVKHTHKSDILNKNLEKKIRTIKECPDAIIFLDDTIYTACQTLFSKYRMFSSCPIITHSNGNEIYPEEYGICRFEFNVEEYADECMDLLTAQIDRRVSRITNRIVTYQIRNADVLKNQTS